MAVNLHVFNTTSRNFVRDLTSCVTDKKRHMSKSYTKGAMAMCVSDVMKIGIDLEEMKRRSPEVRAHFINKFSTFQIGDTPAKPEEQWFYKAWTGMESYFKLYGAGFGTPKDFVLDVKRQTIRRDDKEVAWLEYFDVGNFLICLCGDAIFSKQDVRISYYGWEEVQ